VNRYDGRGIVSLAFRLNIQDGGPGRRREIAAFVIAFYSHTTKKTSATEPRKTKVEGTWSIFKKEKSRRIWKPCERIACVRQRALVLLSVLYFGLQGDCECFTNLFDVPNAWNNMKHTPLHSFILVLSLKGTPAGIEFFD